MKNLMAKTRPMDAPYLIYTAPGWTWKVLKAYSGDPHKKFGRWFLATTSPFTFGSAELGDGYIGDVVTNATLAFTDPAVPAYMIPDPALVPTVDLW